MVSIIIPCYNEEDNLRRLLPRLQAIMEAAPSTELILALAESNTDNTTGISMPPNCNLLICKGKGRARQMNQGALAARGGVLAFLHADVIPPEGFIEDILKTLGSGVDAGFFSYKFDSKSALLKINAAFTSRDGVFTGGGDQCLFIRKKVFQKLGAFSEKQVIMEDFEFFRRMKKAGINYRIVKNDLLVSARKYRYNSYLRVNATNLVMLTLFRLGYPADKLRGLYSSWLHTPYS